MKRLIILLTVVGLAAWSLAATAGDWHSGSALICSDCHVAHFSQQHAYSPGGTFAPLGASGPYDHLLRNDVNLLCLSCHNNNATDGPDVFGTNAGNDPTAIRLAGALNATTTGGTPPSGAPTNDTGYEEIDGHSLWSTETAPGGTFANAAGLGCTDCHMQHGEVTTQYRNLRTSTDAGDKFLNKTVTYATTTNNTAQDVFVRTALDYDRSQVDYNEPVTTASAYGNWCSSCHTNFHGSGGDANMGAQSGGQTASGLDPWVRHPVADVNIGASYSTQISSLTQFTSHTNRVKVMDSAGLWDGTLTNDTVTPSCMSCHSAHGNQNAFGLIFMSGTGTVTEQGDGGAYKDLCRQCHIQGG